MPDWYSSVDPQTPLTQGDLIPSCPLLIWTPTLEEDLEQNAQGVEADTIVMTQACDLENEKLTDVVLCVHFAVSEFHQT